MSGGDGNRGVKRGVPSSSDESPSSPELDNRPREEHIPEELEGAVGGVDTPPPGAQAARATRPSTPYPRVRASSSSDTSSPPAAEPEPAAVGGFVNGLNAQQFDNLLGNIVENLAERIVNPEPDEDEDDPIRSLIAWIIQENRERPERLTRNKRSLVAIERDWRGRGKIPSERRRLNAEMNKKDTRDLIRRLTAEMDQWERVDFRTRMTSVIPEEPGNKKYPIKVFFEDLTRIKEALEEEGSSSDSSDGLMIGRVEDKPRDRSPPPPEGSVSCK